MESWFRIDYEIQNGDRIEIIDLPEFQGTKPRLAECWYKQHTGKK